MIIKINFIDVNIYKHHLESNTDLKDKPISIFNDYIPTTEELNINPYNFLIINEPNELFGLHDWAIYNSKSFSGILTWSEKILTQCENSILMPFGMSFLHENNRYEVLSQLPKQFEISYICGAKQSTQGHILRHKIFNLKNQINIPSKWFYTTEEPKEICFRNSMFHIAVENVKDNNWFTEKLIDAFIEKPIQRAKLVKQEFYSPVNMAKQSVSDNDFFVTETLAKIYIKQGNLAKAIKVYQNLSLKNPEKNNIFATQIKILKEQLHNKTGK